MKLKRKLPAYPIFLKDPNFSLWSVTERLNAANLQTWYGEEKKFTALSKPTAKYIALWVTPPNGTAALKMPNKLT